MANHITLKDLKLIRCIAESGSVTAAARQLHESYPSLNVGVVPDATDSPFEAIEEDRVDVAIVSKPESASLIQEKNLCSDELFAVMGRQNPLAHRKYLNPSDFSDQTLLLYTGTKHAIIEEVLRPAAVTPQSIIQIRITEAIVELARDGRGIAILSGWAFSDLDNAEGLLAVRIMKHGMRRTGKIIQNSAWRKTLQSTKSDLA